MFEAQLHQSKFQQIPSHAVSLSFFFLTLLSPPTQLSFLVFTRPPTPLTPTPTANAERDGRI